MRAGVFEAAFAVEGDGAGVALPDAEPDGVGSVGAGGGEDGVHQGLGDALAVAGGGYVEAHDFDGVGAGDTGRSFAAFELGEGDEGGVVVLVQQGDEGGVGDLGALLFLAVRGAEEQRKILGGVVFREGGFEGTAAERRQGGGVGDRCASDQFSTLTGGTTTGLGGFLASWSSRSFTAASSEGS